MRNFVGLRSSCAAILLLAFVGLAINGCSRGKYRVQADHEAYDVIAERNFDPRWQAADYSVEIDPRSRYFDAYDPDHSPMPLDDPSSHEYMRSVAGVDGWKHWHDNGDRMELENPVWREALSEYVEVDEDGTVKMNVDAALRLAYVHSPAHQTQLETLYLSALDVTAERFRLDTQFFGSSDTAFEHSGGLAPPGIARPLVGFPNPVTRPFVFPAGPRAESSLLSTDTAFRLSRRFATAGELLAGFANSFVFEFTGGDANLTASLASFSIIQPLLRGAGKDIALEQLTLSERTLLANLRAYNQFRQGFYTQVVIGELGVVGTQRFGGGTNLQSFSGAGGVGGYLGLLQQLQQIQYSEDNLRLQVRTLDRLEALYDNELIDLVQVDQFRQSIEDQRSELLVRNNALELALDNYKTDTLGLPPSLGVELDQNLISQFQLFSRDSTPILTSLLELQRRLATIPVDPDLPAIRAEIDACFEFVEPVARLFENAREQLAQMEEVVPRREQSMTDKEKELFLRDRTRLFERLEDLERGEEQGFDVSVAKLESLRDGLTEETRSETLRGLFAWVQGFLPVVERLSLVPAQARLEMITVESIDLKPEDAFQVALANRLDFMNGRAALVDRWRAIQVTADALQSVLNVTASGDLRTGRNNAVSFRAPTGSLKMGLEFDAPFTRLLERNAYRESLINYQRNRRNFIQSRDSLELALRALVRNLEQNRQQLEIQRRAVAIAMRRVDQTQLSLNTPPGQLQPGARPSINPTTAINLLGAQSALQGTQNNFLAAWLRYDAARLRLYREMGIMQLDPEGRWVEFPIGGTEHVDPVLRDEQDVELVPLPPLIPAGWIEIANYTQPESRGYPTAGVVQVGHAATILPVRLRRLPPTARSFDTNRYISPR